MIYRNRCVRIIVVATKNPFSNSIWVLINLYVGYITTLQVGPQTSPGSSQLNLTTSTPSLFPSVPLYFPVFPSQSFTPQIFQPPHVLTSFPLLQSLISGVIIIIFPPHMYSHVHRNPKESSQLQRIFLELVQDVKQCSTMNSPKALSILDYQPHYVRTLL